MLVSVLTFDNKCFILGENIIGIGSKGLTYCVAMNVFRRKWLNSLYTDFNVQ